MINQNMTKVKIYLSVLFLSITLAFAEEQNVYLEVNPQSGDGIRTLFRRYLLPYNDKTIQFFKENNKGKFAKNYGLLLNQSYILPVELYEFNGKTIRSTIGNPDWDNAKAIEVYNDELFTRGIKKRNFRDDRELWVPLFRKDIAEINSYSKSNIIVEPLFGEKLQDIEILDNSLSNNVYYIVSGHGGPDPGAIGYKGSYELHEEEYAYDVSLRLARNLMQHGATVYIIVQDINDGIRDMSILNNRSDEKYLGGFDISANQLERLRKRTEIVNELYDKHKSEAKIQIAVITHVDSRITDKRIDIFFYYAPGSELGKKVNTIMLNTIEEKYKRAQPNRGYKGTISSRNLYVLRHMKPVCVFIELGNIQNKKDQDRLLIINNRQAIANWLLDGLIEAEKSIE